MRTQMRRVPSVIHVSTMQTTAITATTLLSIVVVFTSKTNPIINMFIFLRIIMFTGMLTMMMTGPDWARIEQMLPTVCYQ